MPTNISTPAQPYTLTLNQVEVISIIVVCCAVSLIYSVIQFFMLKNKSNNGLVPSQVAQQQLETQKLLQGQDQEGHLRHQQEQKLDCQKVQRFISQGANYYFEEQAKIVLLFAVVMAIIIAVAAEEPKKLWITSSFILGCLTSCVGAFIALEVSLIANSRCATLSLVSVTEGFKVAFQAGIVVGFSMISIGVLVLLILILVFLKWNDQLTQSVVLFSSIAGFGLGTSTIAFFGRVGGGIFAKSADISADLVGKVIMKPPMNEDSTLNACTIADAVGDNINDAVGMATDLYGSLIEAICAAFLLSTQSAFISANQQSQYYPLLVVSLALIPCMISSAIPMIGETKSVKYSLQGQQGFSTILLIPFLFLASYLALPSKLDNLTDFFEVIDDGQPTKIQRSNSYAFFCTLLGLFCSFCILLFNRFFTSNQFAWVKQVVKSCITGAATNIIFGVALGSKSTIISIFSIVFTSYFSHYLLGAYGVALAAIGMLSNFAIRVAVDFFNPVTDNALSITRQSQMGEANVKQLDTARIDISADCKSYSVGAAGLVSVAVYGAYLSILPNKGNNYKLQKINVISPLIFSCVLLGAMLPYIFSAMCMKAVCNISKELQKDVHEQLHHNLQNQDETKPSKTITSNTSLSLRQQFLPLLLTLLSPLMFGLFIGPQAVVGIIPGCIISGVSMAASQVNSGCAWEGAKKWLECKDNLEKQEEEDEVKFKANEEKLKKRREKNAKLASADTLYAGVVGDLVGDIQKSCSGPGINTLMKFMTIFAVACFRLFDSRAVLECVLAPNSAGCK